MERFRRAVRRVGAPACWALRSYWGTAALLAAAGGAGLFALLPVTSLADGTRPGFASRLAAPLLRVADLGLGRSSLARRQDSSTTPAPIATESARST